MTTTSSRPGYVPEGRSPQAALGADLRDAGYTVGAVVELLGTTASSALTRGQPLPAGLWLAHRPGGPLSTLVSLFLLGDDVTPQAVAEAVPRCGLHGLLELGLVTPSPDGRVRAALDLRPYQEVDGPPWWVVSDLGVELTGHEVRLDHVLGIGQASLTLAAATIRRPVPTAVDLGTGCGVQALHLTRHAREVIATDVSARALECARLGLQLSGVRLTGAKPRVELLTGDLLTPLAGRQADLIVSNPPFVISPPGRRFSYRDGGRTGDGVVAELIAGVGALLRPGGIAQLLGNWEIRHGQTWQQRVTDLLDTAVDGHGRPLDAWVVQRELLDPAQYADVWVRDGGSTGGPARDLLRAFLADLASRDVEAIGLGLVTLRRPGPGTAPLRRVEHCAQTPAGPLGPHLDACLAAHDALAVPGAGAADPVLQARLLVTEGVVEERLHRPGDPDPFAVRWRQQDGFGRVVDLSAAQAAAFGACDGELPFGVICSAVAQLLDVPAAGLTDPLLPTVRDLVIDGFLRPAPTGQPKL